MRIFLILQLLILFAFKLGAQDKLFFANGTSKKGMIVSNQKDFILFRQTDTSQTEKISKQDLILIEDYKGNRYIYGTSQGEEEKTKNYRGAETKDAYKNIFSAQPIGVLFGRATIQYERLTKDLKFGIVIPFSLTYDLANLYSTPSDSTYVPTKGISFITGLDLNYYLGKHEGFQFFIGPRIRYGTDMMLGEVQGYSVQTQFGWKVGAPTAHFVQHISFGFGFARVISVAASPTVDPKQSYAWGSINYRLGFRW